ncbi:NlpC/P60 family protein [Micromonospora sp. 4G57]|uniref:NlpC/P60 family protein n=1 Tax=Micromonospora sicca TaxID=2202420 RepID=A0ABU5JLT6_9ACTN|nr:MULTISPECIES: NlpC/P60 family protein [unclassified Micromonospora]MDZ5446833.1 NlpC/P60 family protein [Micromonospora sp. 4G57]MDZ5493568.1 NlpC/P60 family protein [Micromonospora sp. 4G53]
MRGLASAARFATRTVSLIGTPYTFGGVCTAAHSGIPARQYDCSALLQQAYRAAGVSIPARPANRSTPARRSPTTATCGRET